MNLSPIATAAVFSCAVHIGALAVFSHTHRPPELAEEIVFSSTLQATLIQETQDAGETIAPSAAIDTVETKPMDKTSKLSKHVHELITTATQERDQLKIATKALQTSLARAARDNQSLADDRVELRTENRLLKQQLTQLTAINKESDQVIAEQPTRTEKPLSDSQAASTLPTQQASRSAPDTGNAAVNHKPRPVAGNPKPHYPLLARNQGIEGRVVVNVLVSAQGTVKTISVGQSSGSRLLDKAALQTVKKWRFHPVLHNGKAVPSSETVPVVFKLKDS
jgi:protein TonB|tara:strand:- start:965 stop:1801 length:837 start_codon:yes stop_codon:yes gene_type:complete